jgi:hypothetical protein
MLEGRSTNSAFFTGADMALSAGQQDSELAGQFVAEPE